MYRWLLIVLVLLAAVAGLALGVLNARPVTFDLILTDVSLPLGALVLAALATGVLAGLVLAWLLFIVPSRLGRRARVHTSNKGNDLADSRDA